MQNWEVAALMVLGVLVGAALPALWELRATLRAARVALGTTGKRLDTALEAWTETATRVNRAAAQLNEGGADIKNFLHAMNDFADTLQALRSQIRVASAIGSAVGPAVAAAIQAFRASPAAAAPRGQENGDPGRPTIHKESADAR